MIYGSNEDKRKYIQSKIDGLKGLQHYFPIIKKVIQEFDGKVYNCRLDKAIQEAAAAYDLDHFIDRGNRGGVYCHITYGKYIEICAYQGSSTFDFFYMDKKDLKDGKRIDAAVWLENVNRHYAKLMQDITGLERDLETIDDVLTKLEILKSQIKALVEPLSWTTRDAYNISNIRI